MLVIRHGEPAPQYSFRFLGTIDAPIDPLWVFRPQVRALLPRQPSVVSSPQARARQTAQMITSTYDTDDRLREMSLGNWEGQLVSKLAIQTPDAFGPSNVFDIRYSVPGGEKFEDLLARAREALTELSQRGVDLVVTHSGVIRAYLLALTSPAEDGLALARIRYGEGIYVDGDKFEFICSN